MLETAICKLFCSETSWQVVDDAVQIFGGEGYMRETGLERMLRDARINRIVEGASEVMTAFISLVGMKGVGEDLEQVMRLAKHPVGNFGRLASFARGEWSDVVMGHALDGLHPKLATEGRTFARLTKSLARDVIRLLGTHRERILDMELVHERVTGAAMELYAMAAVISRMQMLIERSERATEGNGHEQLRRDLVVGRSFCKHAAERVERHLESLFNSHDETIIQTANTVLGWDRDPSSEE
jgi:acyl-CoA dehydrogenase family protein 9